MAGGLLDIFDPSVAQEFSLDPEERKRLMLGNWLMGISSGLLGSRKGQELQGLGFGSLAGMGAAQQAVRDADADKYQKFKMMSEGQKIVDQRKSAEQAARDQQELQGIFAGGGQPDLAPLANGQGPTVANAAAQVPGSPKGDAYRKAAAWYAARGNTEGAKRMMDMANSFDEEFSQTPQVMMREGKPVNALIGKRGTVKTLEGYDPTPKFREMSDGKTNNLINEYTVPPTGLSMTMKTTPGQDQANAVALGHLALARNADQRAAANQANPQPVFHEGQFVYPPNAPGGARAEPVPGFTAPPSATIKQAAAQNNVTISNIDRALTLVDERPKSVGIQNQLGDAVAQRIDPQGVEVRAAIANIGSQKIHDRSGAAVSLSEAPRLQPFVPAVTDTPAAVKKKLQLMRAEAMKMQEELNGGAPMQSVIAPKSAGATGGWSIKPI